MSNKSRSGSCLLMPPNAGAALVNLFAFPCAGGGATSYIKWRRELPKEIAVWGVQPPGRENRLREPLSDSIEQIVSDAVGEIAPLLDKPYVVYGHSFGSILAHETVLKLEQNGLMRPSLLVVSGRQAPQVSSKSTLHQISDGDLKEFLRQYSGTPQLVLQDTDMMNLLLPVLRADLKMNERYRVDIENYMHNTPIFALCGNSDPLVSPEQMSLWNEVTASDFEMATVSGGHFFIQEEQRKVLELIRDKILVTTKYSNLMSA